MAPVRKDQGHELVPNVDEPRSGIHSAAAGALVATGSADVAGLPDPSFGLNRPVRKNSQALPAGFCGRDLAGQIRTS